MSVRSIPGSQTRFLRRALLRPEQPPEDLAYPGDDAARTLHVGAFAEGALVGIASVFADTSRDELDVWRLRGMATTPSVRGQGFGSALLRACLAHVARLGGTRAWCDARTPAVGFYARHGFAVCSDVFDLPGIGPHERMERRITRADAAGPCARIRTPSRSTPNGCGCAAGRETTSTPSRRSAPTPR